MNNIVFVGDSYCSAWTGHSVIPHRHRQQPFQPGVYTSWLDVAASQLGLNLYSFGFAGASWFYSRQQLFFQMTYDPDWIRTVDLMVFCHTNSHRYNTQDSDIGVEMLETNYTPHPDDSRYKHKQNLSKSLRTWALDLVDNTYQDYAQQQWFHEIARSFKDVPQIHFNNYPFTVDIAKELLPGMVYTTPLVHISLGEATGTDAEILKKAMTHDQRVNHFSAHNNQALGQLVVDSAQNYQPGARPIDLTKFELINPNASRWPNPGFGTS